MAVSRAQLLGAAVAAFIAWGYLTFWFPTLQWMGYALVTGILGTLLIQLAAILLVYQNERENPEPQILLRFQLPTVWKGEVRKLAAAYPKAILFASARRVSAAVDGLLRWILRDFVASWYVNISPNPAFLDEVEIAIRDALVSIGGRLAALDLVEVGVTRFVPVITQHLQDFVEAERAVRGQKLEKEFTESEELDLAISARYRNGRLHPALSSVGTESRLPQKAHLRELCTKLLPIVMPASQVKSKAVVALVREIVSCAVLSSVLQMLSDPDTWNQIIENLGRDVIQDRRTVKKLRAALDQHASPQAKRSNRPSAAPTLLKPFDSDKRFEQYIRSIRYCSNVNEARKWRNDLTLQLNRDTQRSGTDLVYLRRLETCKSLLERKIQDLAGTSGQRPESPTAQRTMSSTSMRLEKLELRDVLRSPNGLSYFMEFMDRRHLTYLVQYWLLVDGMRDPLEPDDFVPGRELPTPSPSNYEDLLHIHQLYFGKPELQVSVDQQAALTNFIQSSDAATPLQYGRARSAVLQVQTTVYEDMSRRHFARFKTSDLFFSFKEAEFSITANFIASPVDGSSSLFGEEKRPPLRPVQRTLTRSESAQSLRSHELRKTALSNSGLLAGGDDDDFLGSRRTSVDSTRKLLFGDEGPKRTSSSHEDGEEVSPEGAVEAMESALTGIMAEAQRSPIASRDTDATSQTSGSGIFSNPGDVSSRSSRELTRPEAMQQNSTADSKSSMPTLSSLGLVNKSIRIGVFSDSDLFPDDEVRFAEDEQTDNSSVASDLDSADESIAPPAPGDLGLAEAISALNVEIRRLVAQEAVLDSLIKKAELVNNAAEIRILGKSKSSLTREIKRKELRRQQFMVQEGDSGLYGRSNIHIKSTIVGQEDNGHEYALYIVEVQRFSDEQLPATEKHSTTDPSGARIPDISAQWAVARRYSEFHALHRRLRQLYPVVRDLEFPRRKVVARFGREFLERRRRVLEAYLRELLRLPDICRSRDFRAFLSQQAIPTPGSGDAGAPASVEEERQDLISRLFQTVSSGVEDVAIDFPVLEHLSMSIPLGVNLTNLPGLIERGASALGAEDPRVAAEAEAELGAFQASRSRSVREGAVEGGVGVEKEPFIKPICDLFLELFDLNSSQSWLRGRAVVLVLHQLLGGTIERRVRDQYSNATSEASLVKYIELVKSSMWDIAEKDPTGPSATAITASKELASATSAAVGSKPLPSTPGARDSSTMQHPESTLKRDKKPRTPAERARSKLEANILLQTLVPDLAGGVVGRANAKSAARKLVAVLNNGPLMEHLVFVLFDEIVGAVFGPEVFVKAGHEK